MTKRIGVFLAALVSAAGLSGAADDKITNGAACVSDGASIVDDSGSRLSTATGSAGRVTTFVCPLVRDSNIAQPFSLGVRINARNGTFQPTSTFKCTVRTVTASATTVTSTQVFVPARADASDDGFVSVAISPLTVPLPELSYVLFCSVPDVASGARSGIVSYKWGE